ncbi:arylamine N-acetyltransferase [Nodosilinea sp. LEGE 07088]|uniref:arylamine N-acetyltransferase family protein n=1 Tax=Nodosilinea sp. LEGE 07088 TaxID=2777968 RepID=UPI00187F27F9|nr:arylamine N-acetyltransferase [Nodosilinea sp. LEGE 07088]MBE9137842.1 arylamine N-acetyltransferase [Nodosilinea sp. LEGE 07088]
MPQATSLAADDLEAYFQRIGYGGSRAPTLATLQGIHQRHPQAIAFENLSSFLGQPVDLELPSLVQKLVYGQRGGYCFEQNGLLKSVLTTLGFQVTGLGARVLWQLPPDTLTPRSHMVLLVDLEGEPYLADVGFGGLTLTAPLRLIPNVEQETPHEPFRLIQSEGFWVLQAQIAQDWKPLYQFDLQPQYACDYGVSNWHVATHPASIFVTGLMVARVDGDSQLGRLRQRRYGLRNTQLATHYMTGQTEKRQLTSVNELEAVLTDIFRLKLPENSDFTRLFES